MLLAGTGSTLAADSTYTWLGNGYPNESCSESSTTMLWIWTGDSPTSLTINGELQSGSWVQMGGGSWHFTTNVDATNYPPTTGSTSITYSGSAGTLTLSGCDEGGTQPTDTPSGSGAGATDTPAPTDTAAPTDTPAPTDTAAPTGTPEGTGAGATDTPVPTGGGAGDTEAPTQPPTNALGANGSGPSDGAWLLVVGLGVLLASIVVLTPARAKSRR
jgi:hypothetical protein